MKNNIIHTIYSMVTGTVWLQVGLYSATIMTSPLLQSIKNLAPNSNINKEHYKRLKFFQSNIRPRNTPGLL
jgi:hypothetical protein